MRSKIVMLLVVLGSALGVKAQQQKVEPSIILLYPFQVDGGADILTELKTYDKVFEISLEERAKFIDPGLPANWKMIREKELDYRMNQSFLANMVIEVQSNLIYRIIEYHNQPLIFPVRDQCIGTMKELKTKAQEHGVSWVINFPKVEFVEDGGKKSLKIKVQLYNLIRDRLHINKEYTLDVEKKNEETACEDGSWWCAVTNFTPLILTDLLHELERNRRYWH
jgi:hypothetical protein